MTHNNIYNNFMIEYDKADVTSSYPSLTKTEAFTILDKAYNALIAQKVTGNNTRRAGFEYDTKAISDLQPLIVKYRFPKQGEVKPNLPTPNNVDSFKVPSDFLYFVDCIILKHITGANKPMNFTLDEGDVAIPVKLVTHSMAEGFFESSYNMPWVKQPVCYIEGDRVYVVFDSYNKPQTQHGIEGVLSYIQNPKKFVDHMNDNESPEFECNDTVAEELISLAITFALENVESQRLNSKLNTRGLEA